MGFLKTVFYFGKTILLSFGRVLVRDFVLFFCIDTFTLFVMECCRFVGPQGLHGVPNESLLGILRDQLRA